MNEMVERVARVMFEVDRGGSWDDVRENSKAMWRSFARSAIGAMREPTEAMQEAGWATSDRDYGLKPSEVWSAMIKAALSDGR
jgi:hypothetical protein